MKYPSEGHKVDETESFEILKGELMGILLFFLNRKLCISSHFLEN